MLFNETATDQSRWTWKGMFTQTAQALWKEGPKRLWRKALGEAAYRRAVLREPPPGASPDSDSSAYWSDVLRSIERKPQCRDTFLGVLKRQMHLELILRWGGTPRHGYVLKTDLFEEAIGLDAFLTDLREDNNVVVGMDLSAAVVARAQGKDARGKGDYTSADVRRLPFADGSFALIISSSTLDHFIDPRDLGRSLRELVRVLQPGGRLIITLDNRQNIFDPLLRLAQKLGWTPYYLGKSYRIDELRAELEAVGLRVEETTAILHNPRLMAVVLATLVTKLGWSPLTGLVQRALLAAQRLERTRLCYYTGSFVAAKARRKG
jgi:SAM-dependent methyltransferase